MDGGTRALDGATQAKGQDADKQTRQRHGQADPCEELQLKGVLGRRNTLMLELMGERDEEKERNKTKHRKTTQERKKWGKSGEGGKKEGRK